MSADQGALYLVSYDVKNDAKRKRLANALLNYGKRVQYSVFEAWLDVEHLQLMLDQAVEHIDEGVDSLRVYPLCGHCHKKVILFGRDSACALKGEEIIVL